MGSQAEARRIPKEDVQVSPEAELHNYPSMEELEVCRKTDLGEGLAKEASHKNGREENDRDHILTALALEQEAKEEGKEVQVVAAAVAAVAAAAKEVEEVAQEVVEEGQEAAVRH